MFASWASRIPAVRDGLGLGEAALGLVLLALGVGSIAALVASGAVVARIGSRRSVTAMTAVFAVGMLLVAAGSRIGVGALAAGLVVMGFGLGGWDVAMNVQGALVQQRLGRSIMPRFHAGYSVGTVFGALTGTLAVALGVPATVHLAVVAVLVPALVVRAVRGFLPDAAGAPRPAEEVAVRGGGDGPDGVAAAWRERRTLLLGVFVLAFAFAEGTGLDWIGVALIDGYGAPEAVGTLALALFLTAMTLCRWFGPLLLDAYGRVAVSRALALVGAVGVALFVLGGSTPVAMVGVLLWGTGVALGFPIGMSAAGDDPRYAAVRVSVVAAIGYCALLAGPPLVGLLGDQLTVLKSVTTVAALLSISALLAGSTRPRQVRPA